METDNIVIRGVNFDDRPMKAIQRDAIQKMASNIIEKHMNEAMSSLWSSSTLDDGDFNKGTLTLDKLLEATKRFREMPPVVQRIYFVDRLEQYAMFCQLPNVLFGQEALMGSMMAHYNFGVQIYIVNSKDYEDDSKKADTNDLPEFCKTPGIWVVMSDGTHKKLDDE